jgi:hypothetical protein
LSVIPFNDEDEAIAVGTTWMINEYLQVTSVWISTAARVPNPFVHR